ncbi:carbohydrate-binding domain-containing protein [Persicitalea jodogahamensis]|uniref:Carbohydrate-binding domain-containing protein n=1 Tax=Persicitalea jodogahamensis TaxID=402147 RepID=A0A8J3D599_9BACT|nr:carbohydrate-binding domain-containing protein [Persicitalea jodogahamensis]GHB61833.1 hypothetical protein GCM10007390_14670 [Persicitalea jodogahamensis]
MKTNLTNNLLRSSINLLVTGILVMASCQKPTEVDPTDDPTPGTAETGTVTKTSTWNGTSTVGAHEAASDYVWNASDVVPIKLNGTSITIGGAGATASGSVVTITSAGTYSLSGSLTNGQVIVNAKDAVVRLILDGVNIHSSVNAPVYVKKAEKVVLVLADNSTNVLTDAANYTYDVPADEEPNAAVFSKSDLTIFGTGTLDVTGNFGDGIVSKDGLIVKSGNITVKSADDAIRGKDYLVINDGKITIDAKADGLKSSNDSDAALGYVIIDKGDISITSGDDGVHAETSLTINGGTVSILKSYEGLEGQAITVNAGTIHITSSDDGINAASTARSGNTLTINGGYMFVDANGDGLDANGSIVMTGGVVIVAGPTASNNGALDYDATFNITGGYLLAVGSSGMAQAPGTSSTQNSVLIGLTSAQAAGTVINLQSGDGKSLFTFQPSKKFQSIAFSSPGLTNGSSFSVYTGGTATGTATDGLYQEGTYTSGTKFADFTVSTAVTKVGTTGGGGR